MKYVKIYDLIVDCSKIEDEEYVNSCKKCLCDELDLRIHDIKINNLSNLTVIE